MRIRIYQIDLEKDSERLAFESLSHMERIHGSREVNSAIYQLTYDGSVECGDLEGVFRIFNVAHPEDYRGRSLSVSDVVEVIESDSVDSGFYYCDSFGFAKIAFTPPSTELIRVVLVEPGKTARDAAIDGTLKGMQALVGGYIEVLQQFPDGAVLVCCEEAKQEHRNLNRAIYGRDWNGGTDGLLDIIAGTFFICGTEEDEFVGLDETQCARYLSRFRYPERFFRSRGQIQVVQYEPNGEHDEEETR